MTSLLAETTSQSAKKIFILSQVLSKHNIPHSIMVLIWYCKKMSGLSHDIFSGTVHQFLMQNIKVRYQNIKVGYHNSPVCSFPPNHSLYHPPLQKIVKKFITIVKLAREKEMIFLCDEAKTKNTLQNNCLSTQRPPSRASWTVRITVKNGDPPGDGNILKDRFFY